MDWFEWGDDAFAAARERDQPIFLSVGYAACHWCHVMAHECFENEEIASLLNRNFIAVKVDREERPDVDALYMAATQLVSGHGGWPMSVFLTPEGEAFMAGTYYPPDDSHGRPGFPRLLSAMDDAWHNQRDLVRTQAREISQGVLRETRFVDQLEPASTLSSFREISDLLVNELLPKCDDDGGFGAAPKFPRPSYLESLLGAWDEPAARFAIIRTLDAMSRRGLYDHIGGGFARYSVDGKWHVPHFEKMLSDQALLAMIYLRADRRRGGGTPWRSVALDTLRFVARDLRTDQGYASSLDADSNGEEGLHITWTPAEVQAVLAEAGLAEFIAPACQRWSIGDPGNFEERSIPMLSQDANFTTPPELEETHQALLSSRRGRPQPGRDNKVILEWNAMFAAACCESDDTELVVTARGLLSSLVGSHFVDGVWWRTEARTAHATSADLGWLIEAHLCAFEESGDATWLALIPELISYLLTHFWDGPLPRHGTPHLGNGFFTTSDLVTDLPQRPKDVFDGATPSSHAVCATALARYGLITSNDDILAVAHRLVTLAATVLNQHPSAVPDLARAYGFLDEGLEIVIPGEPGELSGLVRSVFVPHSVLVTGTDPQIELLEGRHQGFAYVCHQRVCGLPVSNPSDLSQQLSPRIR